MLPVSLRVLALFLLFSLCGPVWATPTNCDQELSEAQKTQRTFCETFGPCAFVLSIFDTCTQVKSLVGGLGSVKQASDVNIGVVERAVRGMAVLDASVGPDGPSLSNCLPGNFDRSFCRQYLGIERLQVKVPATPRTRTPEVERQARMLALYKEADAASSLSGGPHSLTAAMLASCAAARNLSTREQVCNAAQQQVDACNATDKDWAQRRVALLAEIDQVTPGVGKEYTPRKITTPEDWNSSAEMWNDTVRGLRSLVMPACPFTLPDTFLTPAQALALWTEEDAKAKGVIARCDAMSRDVFDAIDNAELDQASQQTDRLEAACSREFQAYADQVRLARQRISTARNARAPRKPDSLGSSLFNNAINQAEYEEENPAAREARLRAEDMKRQADARRRQEYESTSHDTGMLSAVQGGFQVGRDYYDTKAAANAAAEAERIAQMERQLQGQEEARQQAEEQARRRQEEEQQRAEDEADKEESSNRDAAKYYAPLGCIVEASQTIGGNHYRCARNDCGRKAELHFSGGMTGVDPKFCYSLAAGAVIYATCEVGHGYDRARKKCRR